MSVLLGPGGSGRDGELLLVWWRGGTAWVWIEKKRKMMVGRMSDGYICWGDFFDEREGYVLEGR